jgi:hypothetical protein
MHTCATMLPELETLGQLPRRLAGAAVVAEPRLTQGCHASNRSQHSVASGDAAAATPVAALSAPVLCHRCRHGPGMQHCSSAQMASPQMPCLLLSGAGPAQSLDTESSLAPQSALPARAG